jgi:hypothetical protein
MFMPVVERLRQAHVRSRDPRGSGGLAHPCASWQFLRLRRRDQDPQKDRPLTLHLIVSVAGRPDFQKVRYFTDLRWLRVKMETYIAPEGSEPKLTSPSEVLQAIR